MAIRACVVALGGGVGRFIDHRWKMARASACLPSPSSALGLVTDLAERESGFAPWARV